VKDSKPILLVEDDDVDIMTVKRAFQHLNIPNRLVHLRNGIKALEYLNAQTNSRPLMIILDLNMPRMNGLELLKIIKADDVLKEIPVVVLTTSDVFEDIEESFNMSVAGYIVKPIDFDHFVKVFGTIHTYWSLCELPDAR
jgi:CheY-like chemotaxis protein